MTIAKNQLQDIIGSTLIDSEGDKIGKISEVYLDSQTTEPEWIATHTGLFGTRLSFVPMQQAELDGSDVRVPFTTEQVKSSPNMDADGSLSTEQESELYSHYGMSYSFGESDTGLANETDTQPDVNGNDGFDTSGPTTDDAMTRSEEQLRAGTERHESGRARMHKYIVTEQQTVTVPVSHEEVRLVTEPITDGNADAAYSGPAISEEEHEVILHAETPVVTTETVAKERVRLDTEVITEDKQIEAEVRKERIELEDEVKS